MDVRRGVLRVVVATIVSIFVAVGVSTPAATAAVPIDVNLARAGAYTGWHVYTGSVLCTGSSPRYVVAYRPNGSSWLTTYRYGLQHVYVTPYASGWYWTWSSDQGWLVMRASDLTWSAIGCHVGGGRRISG